MFLIGLIPMLWVASLNLKIYKAVIYSSQTMVLGGLRRHVTRSTITRTVSGTVDQDIKIKKNEHTQFMILLSIVIIFIICSIPRTIILMHEVTIIDIIR